MRPDVVVMDITMPRLNGLEASREIKRLLPQTEIVIVSQHDSPEMIREAYSTGARAYLVKSTIGSDLVSVITKLNGREPVTKGTRLERSKSALHPQEIPQQSAFEKALPQSEEYFRAAMNNMAEGLYTLDTQGLLTYVNPSAAKLFGWTPEELLRKKMHDITHYKHPDGSPFPATDCPGLKVLQNGTGAS